MDLALQNMLRTPPLLISTFGVIHDYYINNANSRYGHRVPVYDTTRYLSKVRLLVTAVTGSPVIECAIYASTSGVPGGSPLATAQITVTTTGVKEFTFSPAVEIVPVKNMFVVLRNASTDPTTNYVTFKHGPGNSLQSYSNSPASWAQLTSSDGGSTWTIDVSRPTTFEIEWSNGDVWGYMIDNFAGYAMNAAGKASGMQWAPPVNLNIHGYIWSSRVDVPTGETFKLQIYDVNNLSTPVGESNVIPGELMNVQVCLAFFPTPVTIQAGTTYRFVLRKVTHVSTNYAPVGVGMGNRIPFDAKYVHYDGSNWNVYNNIYGNMNLIATPASGGSGGSKIINPFQIIT